MKDRKTAELQAEIDILKKEKERIEAELALQKAVKLKQDFDSNQ